jgi:hypothetical protein
MWRRWGTTFVGDDVVGSIPTCCTLKVWPWTFGSKAARLVNKSAGQPSFFLAPTETKLEVLTASSDVDSIPLQPTAPFSALDSFLNSPSVNKRNEEY